MLRSTAGRHNPACYTRRGNSPAVLRHSHASGGMARIEIKSEITGTVKEILVKEKEPVAEGQVVAVLDG